MHTSHRIASHRIASHHITSHHITPNPTRPHPTTPHHITSHHIKSLNINSNHLKIFFEGVFRKGSCFAWPRRKAKNPGGAGLLPLPPPPAETRHLQKPPSNKF